MIRTVLAMCVGFAITLPTFAQAPATEPAGPVSVADQPANTWVKRSPLESAPASPRLGYESSLDWDPFNKVLIRHAGHNQGGGGEQNAETWTLDPLTMKWEFRQPNTSPPGACCCRDNVFAHGSRQFVRFPAFSNSHGWQWPRKIAMRNWTAWGYDAAANTWRNMRPLPHRGHGPGRCATYDSHHDCIVLFSGEGDSSGRTSVYDIYTNTWHTMDPSPRPGHRCYAGLAYDQTNRKSVLFGAHYSDDPKTWLYDIRTNTWTDAKVTGNPPSNKTAPVMAYDSVNKVMVAVVRASDKDGTLQTWVYDPAKNLWAQMQPEGDLGTSGSRNRLLVFIPELNIFVMENRTDGEQQIWTYRYGSPAKTDTPGAPTDLAVTVAADGSAVLTWKQGSGGKPDGYRVLRGSGQTPWSAEFAPLSNELVKDATFTDRGLPKGVPTYYRVVAVAKGLPDSPDSLLVRAQPRALQHIVVSVLGEKQVEVAWPASPEKDVVGYIVERADVEVYSCAQIKGGLGDVPVEGIPSPVGQIKRIGQFKRLAGDAIKQTSYVDKAVDLTAKGRVVEGEPLFDNPVRADRLEPAGEPYRFAVYAYRVRAVNALGVESGPSPFFLTVPEAVENVFAREEKDGATVKWDARPEKGIKGYYVFRMEGKYAKQIGRVSKLIDGATFTDAGVKGTKRYHVVAVDAIGQEGIVSSPVWINREWHRFYAPFGAGLETWHQ